MIIKNFICYSTKDAKYKDYFIKHLPNEHFKTWHDKDIDNGANWFNEIMNKIDEVDIVFILLSADFIKSDFIKKEEMPKIIKRAKEFQTTIIPVFLSKFIPPNWLQTEEGHLLQGISTLEKPLSSYKSIAQRDDVIVKEIKRIIDRYSNIVIPESNYYISKYLVTFNDYDKFCHETNRELPNDEDWGRENRPVINISWNDANEYCKWISSKTNKKYRLPKIIEWEYANNIIYDKNWCFGNKIDKLDNFAWYEKNSQAKTHEVGLKECNRYNIYDMHGNVWEWCLDGDSDKKILKGGAFNTNAQFTQTYKNNLKEKTSKGKDIGFRLVREE